MPYATDTDVAEYMAIGAGELPDDVERMIVRAGEVVDQATLGRIDTENAVHTDAARKATCAQVEWWLNGGEIEGSGTVATAGYRIGSLQITKGDDPAFNWFAPRARRHLWLAGLLYRGVATR